jgi:hypothetical protein
MLREMTEKEKAAIMMKSIAARNSGNEAEAHALIASLPLPSYLAKTAKKLWGADFLLSGGYNLSEAEAEFGSDWLKR